MSSEKQINKFLELIEEVYAHHTFKIEQTTIVSDRYATIGLIGEHGGKYLIYCLIERQIETDIVTVCDSDKRKGGYYKAAIITSGKFSKDAREKAEKYGTYLLDGKEFQEELAKVRRPEYVATQTSGEPNVQPHKEKTDQSRILSGRKIIIISSVIIGSLILLIAGKLISGAISTAQQRERFKENVNLFLLEGGKLNALTEQGVTNSDFRDQLATTKSAFRIASSNWLPSLSSQQVIFEEAISGWELALEIWDGEIAGEIWVLTDNMRLLEDATEYTSDSGRQPDVSSPSDTVSLILTVASRHFETGQRLLNLELN